MIAFGKPRTSTMRLSGNVLGESRRNYAVRRQIDIRLADVMLD